MIMMNLFIKNISLNEITDEKNKIYRQKKNKQKEKNVRESVKKYRC